MKSFAATLTLAALAGYASAVVKFTNSDFSDIAAGQTFEITWSEATGPVTLTLKNGDSTDLNTVDVIASGLTSDSFTWTPESSLPSGTYALEITDGTDVNYSAQFPVSGGAAASSSSSYPTSVSTVSTTSSALSSTITSTIISTISTFTSTSIASNSTMTTSSASSTPVSTTTRSVTRTTSSAAESATSPPDTNGAQGAVAPLLAPILLAIAAMF